jgi:hypothetical protein
VESEGKSAGTDARPAFEVVHDADVVRQRVGRPACGAALWGRGDEVSGPGLEQDRTLSPKENVCGASKVPDATAHVRDGCGDNASGEEGKHNDGKVRGSMVGNGVTTAGCPETEDTECGNTVRWHDDSAVCGRKGCDDPRPLHGVHEGPSTVGASTRSCIAHDRNVPGKAKERGARQRHEGNTNGELRSRGEVGAPWGTSIVGVSRCNGRDVAEFFGALYRYLNWGMVRTTGRTEGRLAAARAWGDQS